MAPIRSLLRWVRTDDGRFPRFVRLLRRMLARLEARRRNGSISAYMEATVAAANRTGRQ